MSASTNDHPYALGRGEAEEQRLQRQAALYELPTRRFFEAAGIGAGMNVLDLGSGAGDVALLVAAMVGPTGSVVGVDTNPAILETARRRVAAAGHANVTFVAGDIQEVPLASDFDAVVGRYVLMYLRDPAATLGRIAPHLRAGGIAAFREVDRTVPPMTYPPSQLDDQVFRWQRAGMAHRSVEGMMGMKLHQVFLSAGFEAPQFLVDAMMGGSRAVVEELTAIRVEMVRSLLPALIEAGIATAEEVGIETLAARLRDEIVGQGSVMRHVLHMGAWAHRV